MATRNIIRIDEELCDGCGLCIVNCAEGALAVVNGKARVVSETYCDGLGACVGHCPRGALTVVEREAAAFDEEAVRRHLDAQREGAAQTMACGCPGSMLRVFESGPAEKEDSRPQEAAVSELSQWPVQLRLLPTEGRLYEGRNVLLLADCVAAAFPDLHRRLIRGNTIVLTCPKLDDARESVEKLARIFRNPVADLSVAVMEVPCCSGLVRIAREALARSGSPRPLRVTTVGVRGGILDEKVLPPDPAP